MKKIIITISSLIAMSCSSNKDLENKILLMHTIDDVQAMREWLWEDIKTGQVDSAYGEYYLETLKEIEDGFILYYNTK